MVPKVPLHLAFRAREGVVGQTAGGVKQRVVSNGGVVGQTAGGGVIQTWWWPKMTLLLAFRAREMVVVGENPLRHSNREWEGGGGQELQHTSVVSK